MCTEKQTIHFDNLTDLLSRPIESIKINIHDFNTIKFMEVELDNTKVNEIPYLKLLETASGMIDFATYLHINQHNIKILLNGLTLILKSDFVTVCTLKDLLIILSKHKNLEVRDLVLQIIEKMPTEHRKPLVYNIVENIVVDYLKEYANNILTT